MSICAAYFQRGSPIYSAKSVRFRMGHPKSPNDLGSHLLCDSLPSADDTFTWTYTSPEFPMAQVCSSTTFCISCFSFLFFLGVCGVAGGKGCSGLRELLGIWGVYLITTVKMLKCNLLQAVDMLTPSKIGLLFDFSIKYFFLFFWSAFHSYPEIFAF